jgi:hypothetical protein
MDIEPEELHEALKQAILHGRTRVLGLPWQVRLRLAITHRIDAVGIWLVEHRQFRAAELLWRICRLYGPATEKGDI